MADQQQHDDDARQVEAEWGEFLAASGVQEVLDQVLADARNGVDVRGDIEALMRRAYEVGGSVASNMARKMVLEKAAREAARKAATSRPDPKRLLDRLRRR